MSRETDAIIAFAQHIDPSVIVTATTGGNHVSTSYHKRKGTNGQGLAVDFAFIGGNQTNRMLNLAKGFETVGSRLAELFFDPLGHSWKNGVRINYKPGDHFDHVHVAVPLGTFLSAPAPAPPKVKPMFDPPFPVIGRVVDFLNNYAGPGGWMLTDVGAIYAFGGAPDYGCPNGKNYFTGRTAARLVRDQQTINEQHHYTVVASSAERYNY